MPAPAPRDFKIEVAPANVTVARGETGTVTVSLVYVGAYDGTSVVISVAGLPAGLRANCLPSSLPTAGNCTLALTAALTTAEGDYNVTVQAGNGTALRGAPLHITVVPPPAAVPELELALNRTAATVPRGDEALLLVELRVKSGAWDGAADIVMISPVAGISASCSPAAISPNHACVMTVRVNASAPLGAHDLDVRASSGSLVASNVIRISVTEPAPPSGGGSAPGAAGVLPVLFLVAAISAGAGVVGLILWRRQRK